MASFFDNLFGGGAEKEAADKNRALYAQYGQQGTDFLNSGMAGSKDALATAKAEYAPLSQMYNKGASLYGDALGVNGAAGTANAQGAFTSSPGYQWQLGQGMDAINRRRAAGGMLNSGNADLDALTYGQGLAKQDYGSWLSNLSGYDNKAMGTTSAMAGVDTNLANLYQSDATNRVGLQGNVTSGDAQANNLQAQGEAAGAKNLLGAGLGVASLAMGGMGGGGLSSLGSAFGFGGGNYGQTQNAQIGGYSMPMFR
jgi:hypothetical protein